MSTKVFDLAARRRFRKETGSLRHPAGVTLPFGGPADANLIIPEIRMDIRSGVYSADMLCWLAGALRPGDRVLVVGAGLGVVSTQAARMPGVERVIAIEANTALIPYLKRTHALNGAAQVEVVNAVLASGKRGRVPFFVRSNLRNSSLLPQPGSWQQALAVPFMDLDLILSEERVNVIISDIAIHTAGTIGLAKLDRVERILVNRANDPAGCREEGELCALLSARGYVGRPGDAAPAAPEQTVMLFDREPAAS